MLPAPSLGAALGPDLSTWSTWVATLKAAYAEPLTEQEQALFASVAGNRKPPTRRVREFCAVISRRGGKGRMEGALSVYEACLVDHSSRLAPGETGVVACVSPTRSQARIVRDYALGYLESSPVLRHEIAETSADEIRLRNGNTIVTLASDFRTLRGRTLLLAIMDEASFLRSEESANPDIECARALLPGLSTTGGMLCIFSSPYRQAGLLFQRHRDHYGKDNSEVLVVAGESRLFNPTLDQSVIDAAIASDPEAAQAEWLGAWRKDLQTFLPDDLIDAAIDRARPLELAPQNDIAYKVFVDASGGAHDSFTLAISHKRDDGRVIVDVVRGRRAPFDPASVAREYAALAKEYHCGTVVGDCYSAGWVKGAFEANGVEYKQSPLTRSELYLEGLPLFSRGMVSIPDHSQTLREMRLLQRRTAKSGKDSVDHGAGGTDDYSNALFGSLFLVTKVPRAELSLLGLGGKVFSSSGSVISDSVSYAFDKLKPKPTPSSNDEVFAAGLREQHEQMRRLHDPGSFLPPPTEKDLTPEGRERLKKFKADLERKRSGIGNLHGKC